MLIPAAIVGVIVFLYGCATVDDNIPRYTTHNLHTLHLFASMSISFTEVIVKSAANVKMSFQHKQPCKNIV